MYHQKKIEDFELNELNRHNTFRGSDFIDFPALGHKFRTAFYTTNVPTGSIAGDHAFLCFLAWTPDGWKLLAKLPPIWNGDLAMDMGSPEEDLKNYMWMIEQEFGPALTKHVAESEGAESATGIKDQDGDGSIDAWERVIALLATARIEGAGALKFDWSM